MARFLNIAFVGADHTHYLDFIKYIDESPYCLRKQNLKKESTYNGN